MMVMFYVFGMLAILSTICMILQYNAMYALLLLIISLLSISGVVFFLGASFAAAMGVIVYVGAIMILFMFVIMILNTNNTIVSHSSQNDRRFLDFVSSCGFGLLSSVFIGILLSILNKIPINCGINVGMLFITIKQVGIKLFGSYMLIVEIVSFLLLAALIVVLHLIHYSQRK